MHPLVSHQAITYVVFTVCGSRNEVANEPALGDHFDAYTGTNTGSNHNGGNRESVFFMIALGANDQLRQRVAWALSQMIVLVPDQITRGWSYTEQFLHFYDSKYYGQYDSCCA